MASDISNRPPRTARPDFDGGRTTVTGGPRRPPGRRGPAGLTEPATDVAATATATAPGPTADRDVPEETPTEALRPAPGPAVPPELARVVAGRYCLERELGRGGFGVVFLAYDRELHRQVAVKVARCSAGLDVEPLLEEGRKVAQLDHPHIVPVYDCGRIDGRTVFIVSKYVDGGSLARQLALRKLPVDEAVRLAGQVAEALAHAHERGLIHRDLKPSNILVDGRGSAFVADFGLALRATDRSDRACVEGSPMYMSPEQACGKSRLVDRRTDVFSFGIILYEMLTGRRPFPGTSAHDLREQVIHEEPPAPRRINPEVPERLERVCLKALAKDPERRHASAWELARELRICDVAPRRALCAWCALLAGSAALLLVATLAWLAWRLGPPRPAAPGPTPVAAPAPPAGPSADLEAAAWVLDRGGSVDFGLAYPPRITAPEQLPTGPATLRSVKLYMARPVSPDDVRELARLPGLINLHLSDTGLAEESLADLAGMTGLRMLWVGWNHLTDRGIVQLGRLTGLTLLNLEQTQATDVSVEAICAARDLEILDLSGTRVTDAGLRHLAGLPRLHYLRLNRTAITDAGVGDLLRIPSLRRLEVAETRLSPEGIDRLEAGLPYCTVIR